MYLYVNIFRMYSEFVVIWHVARHAPDAQENLSRFRRKWTETRRSREWQTAQIPSRTGLFVFVHLWKWPLDLFNTLLFFFLNTLLFLKNLDNMICKKPPQLYFQLLQSLLMILTLNCLTIVNQKPALYLFIRSRNWESWVYCVLTSLLNRVVPGWIIWRML